MRAAEAEDPHFLSEITKRQNAGSFFLSFTQPICLFDVSHWCLAQKTQQFLTNIPFFKMTKWDGNKLSSLHLVVLFLMTQIDVF